MFGLGAAEIIVVLAIGLLLFGSQLPGVARSLGKMLAEVRHETNKFSEELQSPVGRRA